MYHTASQKSTWLPPLLIGKNDFGEEHIPFYCQLICFSLLTDPSCPHVLPPGDFQLGEDIYSQSAMTTGAKARREMEDTHEVVQKALIHQWRA